MLRKLSAYLKVLRPLQAYKAGIVWLPALFHGQGSLVSQARILLLTSLAWWMASAVVYILNDLKDAPEDRARPDRSSRPIASGDLSTTEALLLAGGVLAGLGMLLLHLPGRLSLLLAFYAVLNLLYTLGLRKALGVRQAIIAVGFWFRLQSGADPVLPIPLTPWAALFTLGLSYFLNCLKGLHAHARDEHRQYRFAMGLGAGLAGSLALAALVAICLKRGIDGTMAFPELPPLFCLLGMHRVVYRSMGHGADREQSDSFFKDWPTLLAMAAFVVFFLIE